MSMYDPYEKPYKDRRNSPATSIYLISDDAPEMDKLHCLYCKRVIADVKGHVDKVVNTPQSVADFDIAVNIRCKLCHSNYRLLVNGH